MRFQKSKTKIILIALSLMFVTNVNAQRSERKSKKDKTESIEAIFNKRDKNEDGKLEKSELIGLISNDFETVDNDKDGFLSLEELKKAPKFQKKEGRRGGRDREAHFTKMDTNKDGKLSEAEVKGPMAKRFSKIDTNNDGYITKEELAKAPRPERRGQPRQRRGN